MTPLKRVFYLENRGDLLAGFAPSSDDPPFLEDRFKTSVKMFHAAMRRLHPIGQANGEPILFRFEAVRRDDILDLLPVIDRRIASVIEAPLTPRMVNAILGISSQERIRWTKDGRLPTCGNVSPRRGSQGYGLALFPVEAIAKLVGSPDTIEAWRRMSGPDFESDDPEGEGLSPTLHPITT